MTDSEIKLRRPTDDDDTLRAFLRPAEMAFAEEMSAPEFALERTVWEIDRLIGAVDGETWVGTAGVHSFGLTVPGGAEIGAAGITLVGVAPTHRRRGILRMMMHSMLDQARERGEPVAILWASEGAIYQNFGYGMATLQGSIDAEPGRLRFRQPVESLGRMRLLERDEAVGPCSAVYDTVQKRTPGMIARTDKRWRLGFLNDAEYMRSGRGPKFRAVLEVDGEPRAYAIYRVKDDWDDRGPKNVLSLLELVGVDVAAERAMWQWLLGIDLLGRVKVDRAPVPGPLFLALTEPRRLGLTVSDGLWLRLVDMPAALKERSYARAGSLSFELTDEFEPTNAGRWRLEVSEYGEASVTRFRGKPDIALDTADLAATYLGGFTFAALALAGRVEECRPGAIADADALFISAVTPWCSTGF